MSTEEERAGKIPHPCYIARAWNVPTSTLQRRVKGVIQGHRHHAGRKPIIAKEDEAKLAEIIKDLAGHGFLIRKPEVQKFAFHFAEANGLKGFSDAKGQAGHYWFESFMKRHPSLGLRKPEALSAPQASCFNPTVVEQWFQTYQNIIHDLGLQDAPSNLWNCDETGLQDHFVSLKVVSPVGSPCFEVSANTRGETTTLLASLNAAGE